MLAFYAKNLFVNPGDATEEVELVQVVCQFVEIVRLSASGVDLLD